MQAATAGESEEQLLSADALEDRKQAAESISRYQDLVKKLRDPASKKDLLDVLEYQHMKG